MSFNDQVQKNNKQKAKLQLVRIADKGKIETLAFHSNHKKQYFLKPKTVSNFILFTINSLSTEVQSNKFQKHSSGNENKKLPESKIKKQLMDYYDLNTNVMKNNDVEYQDGFCYKGDCMLFENDIVMLNGEGSLTFQNQIVYTGGWKNNKFDGKGTFNNYTQLYNLINWRKEFSSIQGNFRKGRLDSECNFEIEEQL